MNEYILDIETTSLKALDRDENKKLITNKILCISVYNTEKDKVESFYGEDEKKLLKEFLLYAEDADRFVGFNIQFDISFILVRCLLNNIRIEVPLSNFIDIREKIYPFNKFGVGRLRDFCDLLHISYNTHDGSEMLKLYEQKNWEEIRKHCCEDVLITKQLYDKLKELNFA